MWNTTKKETVVLSAQSVVVRGLLLGSFGALRECITEDIVQV